MEDIKISIYKSINDIDSSVWDTCACTNDSSNGRTTNPFTTHRFLSALEVSQSVGQDSGWIPNYLVAERANSIVGVMPMYLKYNSQGEYIFDHNWANAYMRAGGYYYPKFQVAVPFTPVSGRRILTKVDADSEISTSLIEGAKALAAQNNVSSLHFTFCSESEVKIFRSHDLLHRHSFQYHWVNRGYTSFDDFLANLSSRKRKLIRKERKIANEFGGAILQLTGDEIKPETWDSFWTFYQDTGARKWGTPYLTRKFFDLVHEHMRDDVLLVVAEKKNKSIAAALNFLGSDTLFGRYWGCSESHSFLHYELCYYQAIEYAIKNDLKKVEAGAQGDHKVSRGYEPVITNSLHWFLNKTFGAAIENYLIEEKKLIDIELKEILKHLPYKKLDENN